MADNRTYAMLAKPVSSQCSLRCDYCYYRGKKDLLCQPAAVMDRETLESYIRQNIEMHGQDAVIEFAWHGGEPTLAGLDFFREVLHLQQVYGPGRTIRNSIQTNGVGLTHQWCDFFKEHRFEVGVSIDGPRSLHDRYRKGADGSGSFAATKGGIDLLREHGVLFSALTTVNRANMEKPLKVYRFLRGLTDYIQFLPVVERLPGGELAPFSVTPEGYGRFLCTIWDEWLRQDAGKIRVQMFDVALGNLRGMASSLCVHNPVCGHSGSVEANGDVYACDRFAFPDFKLGNLNQEPLDAIMERNRAFGMHKAYGLAEACFDCPYVKLCFGGCPKDRFDGKRNYLCQGYQAFFAHVVKTCGVKERPDQ